MVARVVPVVSEAPAAWVASVDPAVLGVLEASVAPGASVEWVALVAPEASAVLEVSAACGESGLIGRASFRRAGIEAAGRTTATTAQPMSVTGRRTT